MLSNKYNEPSPTGPADKPKNQQGLIIAGILMGLLLLLNVVIYLRGDSKLQVANQLNEQQTKAMSDLQKEIESANMRFDSLSTLFPAKEEEIESLKKQLTEKQRELEKYIAAGGNLAAAKNEIASLREANQTLQAQLEVERNKNASSQARIEELTRDLQTISNDLDQTRQRLAAYEQKENAQPGPNNDKQPASTPSYNSAQNQDKPMTVSSVFVKANEISKKDPNKKRETQSASKTGEIQICFVVEQTEGIGPGTQDFHIQLVDPNMTTIGNDTAPDKTSGNTYKYTLQESMNYDGANAQVCAYYKSSEFIKGTYGVTVWNKGMKVGSGSVTLKK
jgi:hypothetical protein